jgi:hypothetical protein
LSVCVPAEGSHDTELMLAVKDAHLAATLAVCKTKAMR